MVYDVAHHQTLLFGGQVNGTLQSDTWVYNGVTWTQLHPATSPSARSYAQVAYDPNHQNVVLFGGCSDAACAADAFNDTWIWDGTTWTLQTGLGEVPTGRYGAGFTFSGTASNPGVLMFGGENAGDIGEDPWIWNGTGWQSIGTLGPVARVNTSMSWDPIHKVVVLFGGSNGINDLSDTWLWSGTAWTPPNVLTSPPARSSQGQVYDPARQVTVLFGGSGRNDTWLWNGTGWSQESTTTSPAGRSFVNMAYDVQHADTVMFGGQTGGVDGNQTWTLGYVYTSGWMQASSSELFYTGPGARANMAAGYGLSSSAWLFGGIDGSNNLHNDLWLWTGAEFEQFTGSPSNPTPRQSAAMVYIPNTGFLLYGGGTGPGGLTPANDYWIFSSNWTQQVGSSPGARLGHSMVYDPVLGEVVMFGGSNNGVLFDTWTYANGSWSQQDPANSPAARQSAAMVYDLARQQTVLFGGEGNLASSVMSDTWTWDGSNWTQQNPATSPPARSGAQMIYDSVHGTVLLFGGYNGNTQLADMWQWDGVNWTQIPIVTGPSARSGGAAAFNTAAQQFLLYGGFAIGQGATSDVWMYASPYVNSTVLPTGFSGQNYVDNLNPTGGAGTYTVTQLGFPTTFSSAGLSMSSSGVVSGFDSESSGTIIGVGISIADSQGQRSYAPLTFVTDSAITFSPSPNQDATVGTAYTYQLSATGGTAPYHFAVSTSLPWLSVNGSNQLTGVCTTSSTSQYSLTVTDSLAATATAGPFTMNCNPSPQITNTSPLAQGTIGTFYQVPITTNALYDAPGASPFTFSVPPNSLPAGLQLDSSGNIFGTPTTAGTTTFTVTFTDAWGATTSKQLSIKVIQALTITTQSLPTGNLNIPYTPGAGITVTGGVGGYTIIASPLPNGIQVNSSTGAITGTPTGVGVFHTNFTVTDGGSNQDSKQIDLDVIVPGSIPEDWIRQFPTASPGNRFEAASFYDPVHSKTIVFGGITESNSDNGTFSWDGTNWTTLSPATVPSKRDSSSAAFDPVHQQGVMFGGEDNSSNPLNQTWLWNGTNWTQANPANSPPARLNAMMAWDGQHIVLFGGFNGSVDIGDTWIWDGANWTQVINANSPGARDSGGMAYDAVHNQVVLFGGANAGLDFADTWLWNGNTQKWSQATPATSPAGRDSFGMTFDALRGEAVIFGGIESASDNFPKETWAWNGTTWTKLTTLHTPDGRQYPTLVWDALHSNGVLFGGGDPNASSFLVNDTWILDGPLVTNTTLPSAAFNTAYSDTPPVSGGFSPLEFALSGAPNWLSVNSTTGALSGTPAALGNFTFTYYAIDNDGVASSNSLSLTVNSSSPLTLSPNTLPNATLNTNYTVQLSASGGVPGYTFSGTGLPSGLQVVGTQITGQCSSVGPATNVNVKVVDSLLETASVGPLTVTCNAAPAISTGSPLANGTVGVLYTRTLQMNGGTAPITWSLTPGTLPAGFTLNSSTGVLSGTATSATTANFSATVTDFWGATNTKSFTLAFLNQLNITSNALPNGVRNIAFPAGAALAATGGSGTLTYSATGLPPGLQIDSGTGAITGTPTQVGLFSPFFTVSDQSSNSIQESIPITVGLPGAIPVDWVQIPGATISARQNGAMFYDSVHNQSILFGGFFADSVLGDTDLWNGSQWVTLNPANSPSGRTGASAAFDPIHQMGVVFGGSFNGGSVTNETWLWNGTTWSKANPSNVPQARQNAMMAWDGHHIVLFGGATASSSVNDTWIWDGSNWSQVTVAAPPAARNSGGMAFDSGHSNVVLFGGVNSGTYFSDTWIWDGAATTWTQATPANSPAGLSGITLAYDASHNLTFLFGGFSGSASADVSDTWSWNGATWTLLAPPHNPSPRDSYTAVYDSGHFQLILFSGVNSGSSTFQAGQPGTWIFGGPTVPVTTMPPGTQNQTYSYQAVVAGGPAPDTFSSSSLPPGLTLSTTGMFGGMPTAPGNYTVPVTIQDDNGDSIVAQLTVHINAPGGTISLSPTTLPDATSATAYLKQLSAAGGTGNYTFSATGLPPGLHLNSSNQIVGSCSAGSTNVILSVQDDFLPVPDMASVGPLTVNCNPTPLIGTASPLTAGIVNVPYSATIQMTGGTAPITWSLIPGTLPSGFALSQSGVLTGTATSALTANFTVAVTDLWGATNNRSFTLTFNSNLTFITTSPLPTATAGVAYSTTFQAGGGTGVYTFSAPGLPSWLSLNASTGVLAGTPPASGPVTFQVTFTDNGTQHLTQPFTLPVIAGVNITTTSPLGAASVGVPYKLNFAAAGGTPGYTWTATGLPGWLSLTSAGLLSGTPPNGSVAASFQVTATDSAGHAATGTFSLPLNGNVQITSTTLPQAVVNNAYSTQIGATGIVGTATWTAPTLPPGITLVANSGVLNGPVTQAGIYSIQVKVTDSQNVSATATLTLIATLGPLRFTSLNLSGCVQNQSCAAQQIGVAGGIPPYLFSTPPNTDLGGLSLSSSGVVSGTPTGGDVTIPVIVTDAQKTTITGNITVQVIEALTVSPTSLPSGTVNVAYSAALSESGGASPFSWSIASGSLPPGIIFNGRNGSFSGTPTTAGAYSFAVRISDQEQTSPPQPESITINPAPVPLTVSTTSLPDGVAGTAYSQNLGASGGKPPYTWSFTNGSLPNGLTFSTDGVLSGKPLAAGTWNFSVQVSDGTGAVLPATFSLTVTAPATETLLTANPLPDGIVLVPYAYGIAVTGGAAPYYWSITQGQLPPGLTFDPTTGKVAGVPTVKGSFVIVLTVISSGGPKPGGAALEAQAAPQPRPQLTSTYTVRIAGSGDFEIATASLLPNATRDKAYSTTLSASGGTAPYSWKLVDGTLPAGLTLDPVSGIISGTPVTPGAASLLVSATDKAGSVATGIFQLQVIDPKTPSIFTPPLPDAMVGTPYQTGLSAAGGQSPYAWSVSTGSLPPGLSLDPASGAITGTPSQTGLYPFTVKATDAAKASGTADITILVNSDSLTISPASLPNGAINMPYSFGLSVNGGTGPYTWSLSAGGLLSGFSIDTASGQISGTPNVAGVYQFTISVADSNFHTGLQTYQLQVQNTGISITPATPPSAKVGTAYSFGLSAVNGSTPVAWRVVSGTLPPGINLNGASGVLSGTPTTAGIYSFQVQAKDASTATAQAMLTIAVSPALTITVSTLPAGAVGSAYNQSLQTTGATGSVTWSITSGSLPAGLSLASTTGTLSGTPTAAGSFSFAVQATDSSGATATQNLTLIIAGPPPLPAITLSGLPATSNPGDQPTVTISMASGYPLPIQATATLSLTPNLADVTDLVFSNNLRTIQFTIPANSMQATLPFHVGSLPGTIQLALTFSASGVDITPAPSPGISTKIAAGVPAIQRVTLTTPPTGGLVVTVVGTSTTLDMKTATFQFTASSGASLQTSTFNQDVSQIFHTWYANPASLATGSQFGFSMSFSVGGSLSSIASVTVTMQNSAGTSPAVTAIMP